MRSVSKNVIYLLLGTLLLAAVFPISAAPQGWEKVDSFLIGAVNHITGPTALSGVLRKNGYELAIDEINKAGGIDGLPIKIVYEDDQGTNPGAVAATRRMIARQPVLAILICRSTMVNAIHPIIMSEEVPTLFGATSWALSELKNPWFFRMRLNDRGTAAIMAKFMVEDLKKTKIASIYDSDAFGSGGNKETLAYLEENYKITPVTTQRYTTGTKDYTAQLLAIKDSGAEVVFSFGTNAEDCGIILRQFKQLGLNKQMEFIGSASYATNTIIQIAGENVNGIYAVNDFADADPRPELQAWRNAYIAKTGENPDFWGLYTYDAVKLIADAAKRGNIIRKEGNNYYLMPLAQARTALAQALRETRDYTGAQGTYWADEYQNMIHSCAVLEMDSKEPKLMKIVVLN